MLKFLYQGIKYLEYLGRSTSVYHLQSAEMYRWVRYTIRKAEDGTLMEEQALRRAMQSRKALVPASEIGAGSRVATRTIGGMARHVTLSHRYARLLYNMVKFAPPGHVLELGTSLGITTRYLARAVAPGFKVITVEGDGNVLQHAREHLQTIPVVETIYGNFDEQLPNLLQQYRPVLVFVDGNHTFGATVRYFHMLEQARVFPSFWVFDDIYWSPGMEKAWKHIVQHSGEVYTVDLFRMGIVWNNAARVKQHFILRY